MHAGDARNYAVAAVTAPPATDCYRACTPKPLRAGKALQIMSAPGTPPPDPAWEDRAQAAEQTEGQVPSGVGQSWQEYVRIGDNLDIMGQMPDDSVDLIITSPPYADARKHTYGGPPPAQYLHWWLPRAAQMRRILKPTGSLILNIKERCHDGERHTYVLEMILAMREQQNWRWVEEYIWHKTTAAPGKWRYRFRDAWERILHFSKGRDIKMRQDAVKVAAGDWTHKRLRNLSANDKTRQASSTNPKMARRIANWQGKDRVYPSNVLHRPPVCHNTGHSAAFPVWLPEFFIHLFSDPGDTVLDPFSGSGTTVRQALSMGRVPIGIEISPLHS